jgi:hypothetical protein
MELKDFVAQTLTQIIQGVQLAQKQAQELGGYISPHLSFMQKGDERLLCYTTFPDKSKRAVYAVDFDVAVGTQDSTKSKTGLGIFVGGFGVGVQGTDSSVYDRLNRIKFMVPVILPEHALK